MSDRIRALREARGWSQSDLAHRSGTTRQLIGSVEAGRHSPNVAAALALARALDVSVEDLFAADRHAAGDVLGQPIEGGTAVNVARVGERLVSVPLANGVESPEAWGVADAIFSDDAVTWLPGGSANGLVIAGCDPILGMIARLMERSSTHRLLTVHASTGDSVEALTAGRVHGVLVHGPAGHLPRPSIPISRWHVAAWQVGLAGPRRATPISVEEIAERRLRVVQRDSGATSQRAFTRALRSIGADAVVPGPVALGHVDVARRVAQGGGKAGVTMAPAARAFGLGFTPIENHAVELWLDARWAATPAAAAMLDVLVGAALAKRAALLGGYDLTDCGAQRKAG